MRLPPWSTPTTGPTTSPTSSLPTAPACRLAAGSTPRRRSRRSRCDVQRGSGSGDASCDGGRLPSCSLAPGRRVAGEGALLDFASAVVDLGRLGVAEVALDVVALQVAAAAEDLDGVRRVLHAVVAAERLGHGRFSRETHPLAAHSRRAP